jgi:RNA polymerase sigma-70 factor (ECF subfamily)
VTGSDAWDVPIEELGRSGFALALQMLRHREDAADVLQDAVHSAWKHRGRFDPGRGDVRAWFLTIVRNRCLDTLRRRARRRQEVVELTELADPRAASPDQAAADSEQAAAVRGCLADLPSEQREILLLRDFHDLSYAAIAQMLGLPKGTVMSRLHRARGELCRRLREKG